MGVKVGLSVGGGIGVGVACGVLVAGSVDVAKVDSRWNHSRRRGGRFRTKEIPGQESGNAQHQQHSNDDQENLKTG